VADDPADELTQLRSISKMTTAGVPEYLLGYGHATARIESDDHSGMRHPGTLVVQLGVANIVGAIHPLGETVATRLSNSA